MYLATFEQTIKQNQREVKYALHKNHSSSYLPSFNIIDEFTTLRRKRQRVKRPRNDLSHPYFLSNAITIIQTFCQNRLKFL